MSVYRGCTYTYTGNAMSILDCNVLNPYKDYPWKRFTGQFSIRVKQANIHYFIRIFCEGSHTLLLNISCPLQRSI